MLRPYVLAGYCLGSFALILPLLAGCSDDPSSISGSTGTGGSGTGGSGTGGVPLNEQAKSAFLEAFHKDVFSEADAVSKELQAAHDAFPDDSETTLFLGLSHLWFTAEAGSDPNIMLPQLGDHATKGIAAFELAAQQRPDDLRIGGWLGPMKYGMGMAIGDTTMVADGEALVDAGVSQFPEFFLFVRTLIYAGLPKSDPKFQMAVDAMWQATELCLGHALDKANPDITPYLDKQTTTGAQRVCWDGPKMPHNHSGFYLGAGDLIAKAGDAMAAKVLYENAKLVDGYATWPYKAELEQRIVDVDARVASYQDADPMNDAELAYNSSKQCMYCHQEQ